MRLEALQVVGAAAHGAFDDLSHAGVHPISTII